MEDAGEAGGDPILADADRGRIVAFVDQLAVLKDPPNRRFSEWQKLLGLTAPVRDQPHVNAGLIAFSVSAWPRRM